MCILGKGGCADYGKGCALSTIEVCKQQEHTEPSPVLFLPPGQDYDIYLIKQILRGWYQTGNVKTNSLPSPGVLFTCRSPL